MNLIEAEGVCKSFRIPSVRRETVREHFFAMFRPRSFERLTVLDGVSLTVRRGETLGIMGRNGSGKSTLLKILCGIYAPDAGRVTLNAPITPILELGIGWNPDLDAIDNILLIGTAMGLSLREARAAIEAILEFAGLERFARLAVKHYSSGMAARLAYAVAFHSVREVLVLDEVFAVGDAGFRQRCEERYRKLVAAGHTTILVSHDPASIRNLCRRALLIDGGRVVCEGAPAVVAASYLERLGVGAPSAG